MGSSDIKLLHLRIYIYVRETLSEWVWTWWPTTTIWSDAIWFMMIWRIILYRVVSYFRMSLAHCESKLCVLRCGIWWTMCETCFHAIYKSLPIYVGLVRHIYLNDDRWTSPAHRVVWVVATVPEYRTRKNMKRHQRCARAHIWWRGLRSARSELTQNPPEKCSNLSRCTTTEKNI